jgi:hypothetical protein
MLEAVSKPNGLTMGRKRPECEAEDRSPYRNDTSRFDNEAGGPFPAHPQGDALFGRTRRRDSSPYRIQIRLVVAS